VDPSLIKDWLVPVSTFITLITASIGGWLSLRQYRLKVQAETRLARSAELEADIKLLKLFTDIMNIAHARGESQVSDKTIERLLAPETMKELGLSVSNLKPMHVRFNPPEERPGKTDNPLSVEDALKAEPRLAEEFRKNPKKFEQEWRNGLEKAKQDFCSPSSKVAIETKMREPETGPKTKAYSQQFLAACAGKDPSVFFRRMRDLVPRTCGLWVDHFTLEFRKVREGQWLYRQETPGLSSKALKVYELTGDGLMWTLSETRVPTEGAEEKPAHIVSDYELPCEFISHGLIQYP
jgi:hypothetical protein